MNDVKCFIARVNICAWFCEALRSVEGTTLLPYIMAEIT
jgi:hypothetical protein